ncbi:hypothetical protein [Halioglobus japonicus]|uniref:hypothetical protein n=1 Tax=Halioglobus japonicus TaxID=930805 RepID=UPI00197A751B|nr:hypothetical protein [Halioglobus japonicus]
MEPLYIAPHQCVVDVKTVLHARLVAADQYRVQLLRLGAGAKFFLSAQCIQNDFIDGLDGAGAAFDLSVVFDFPSSPASGGLAVNKFSLGNGLHNLSVFRFVDDVVEGQDHRQFRGGLLTRANLAGMFRLDNPRRNRIDINVSTLACQQAL